MSFESVIGTCTYRALYWSSFYTLTYGWSLRALGRGYFPRNGPVLLAANHQSFVDPLLIGLVSKRQLTYLARDTLFKNRVFARLIRHFGAVPIDRGFGKEGLRTVLSELDSGRAVLMFPEGERSHDGELQDLKPGVSLLIKRVTCPILPVGISGPFDAWPRHEKYPTPSLLFRQPTRRMIVTAFGPPLDPQDFQRLDREETIRLLQSAIRDAHDQARSYREARIAREVW